MTNRASENGTGFIRKVSKIVHEWNGYRDIFSRPQVIENARQYLLLRTDTLQKQSLGAPDLGFEFGIGCMTEIYNGTSIRINILYKEF